MMEQFGHYLKRLGVPDTGPGAPAAEYGFVWKTTLLGFATPILFMFLKVLRISLLPLDTANSLIDYMSVVAPVLQQQWSTLIVMRLLVDASNYPAFLLFASGICAVPITVAVIVHAQKWRTMQSPNPGAPLLAAVIFALYYFMMFVGVDTASPTFRSIFDLYFDQIGLFYVRQYLVVFTFWFGVYCFMISVLGLLGVFVRSVSSHSK
jgi:hypothetical protein